MYEKIMILCLMVAVLSAILFDNIPEYKILFGVIGAISAIISITFYLYQHRTIEN